MRKLQLLKFLLVSAFVMLGTSMTYAQGIITTVAGTGTAGYAGDGGLAAAAEFSSPMGVCLDSKGNIYIADEYNQRVRVIDATTGIISTFAGNGSAGSAGTGGLATSAQLFYPDYVFPDNHDNIVITEWYNDRSDIVSTTTRHLVVLCGTTGSGDQGSSGDGGCATDSKMEVPTGACKDNAGNSYMADAGNGRIQMVNGVTGNVATLAYVSGISGVTFDNAHGFLYYSYSNVIEKINPSTGAVSLVAGTGATGFSGDGGAAVAAKLSSPKGMYVDATAQYLYFADNGNNRIRRVNLSTGIITTVAGNGSMGFAGDGGNSLSAELNGPTAVYGDGIRNLYIADNGNQRIRKVAFPAGFPLDPISTNVTSLNTSDVIAVAPNPSNGLFTIQGDLQNATVVVYNVIGKVVYNAALTGNSAEVNMSDSPAGIYTMVLKTSSGVHTEKLIIRN